MSKSPSSKQSKGKKKVDGVLPGESEDHPLIVADEEVKPQPNLSVSTHRALTVTIPVDRNNFVDVRLPLNPDVLPKDGFEWLADYSLRKRTRSLKFYGHRCEDPYLE